MAFQVHFDVDYEGTTVNHFDTLEEMIIWYNQWKNIIRKEMSFYETKEISTQDFLKTVEEKSNGQDPV